MDHDRLYCAEQIRIPDNLGEILRQYTKDIIRAQPEDIYTWSAQYFAKLGGIDLNKVAASAADTKSDRELLDELKDKVKFNADDMGYLLSQYREKANSSGLLDRESFMEITGSVLETVYGTNYLLPAFVRLYDVFDADGNGGVDFVEMAMGLSTLLLGDQQERIKMAFSQFDVNDDGEVSKDEMISYFKKFFTARGQVSGTQMTPSQWAAIEQHLNQSFVGADLDRSGMINYNEFMKVVLDPDHPIGMVFSMYFH